MVFFQMLDGNRKIKTAPHFRIGDDILQLIEMLLTCQHAVEVRPTCVNEAS